MNEKRRSPERVRVSSEQRASSDELGRLQAAVAEHVRSVYRSGTALAAGIGRAAGIHPTDVDALRLLDVANERPTMSELGSLLGLSSAAVTSLVDRLEDAGLARRVRDPEDRRRIHVEPTEAAHQFASEQLRPLRHAIQRAVSVTSLDDLVAVERFLTELLAPDSEPPGS